MNYDTSHKYTRVLSKMKSSCKEFFTYQVLYIIIFKYVRQSRVHTCEPLFYIRPIVYSYFIVIYSFFLQLYFCICPMYFRNFHKSLARLNFLFDENDANINKAILTLEALRIQSLWVSVCPNTVTN